MGIPRRQARAVIQQNLVAIAIVPAGNDDRTAVSSQDRRTLRRGNIRTAMAGVAVSIFLAKIAGYRSPEETFAVGKSLGEKAFPGQVLTLIGDLGVGKTVFTQGLAEGLGIEEPVNSPTFTIVQVYEEGRLPFYHFDVYRIGDIEEMDEVGFEEYVMGEGVSLIEWANLIEEILPERRTNILIEKDLTQGFDYRRITIEEQ